MSDEVFFDLKPKRSFWLSMDRFMRSTHLYTGMFLVPWMLVYAASAVLINHGPAFREWFDIVPPKLEAVSYAAFSPDEGFPQGQEEQAAAILAHVQLEGAHRILLGQSNARQLKIFRMCARGNYVVTWNRIDNVIVVQQQRPFSFIRLINYLHFKGGYGQPYPAHILWAVVVDVVAVSLVFWVISGIYIWARRPRKRLLGGLFLFAGCGLFVALVVAFCS